jgi:hypothetical protein
MNSEERELLNKAFPTSTEDLSKSSRRFICVIYGGPGTGKSSCAATAPGYILWHSFDPGGTESELVQPHLAYSVNELSKDKYILVDRRFEFEDPTHPSAMKLWAQEFERLKQAKAFRFFRTWVIDSLTMMADANMNQHLSIVDREIPFAEKKWGGVNDYADAANKLKRVVREVLAQPIDVVFTGHPDMTTDELNEKKAKSSLLLPGSLKQLLPLMTSEYYISEAVSTPNGVEYRLRTKTDGIYAAKSRAASKLLEYERPNLTEIMKKAGYDITPKF